MVPLFVRSRRSDSHHSHTFHPTKFPSHPTLQLVFRNPITTMGAVGSAVGIGGVLLYTLVKQHYDGQQQK